MKTVTIKKQPVEEARSAGITDRDPLEAADHSRTSR
jgi:hypothetical protein